MSIAIELPKSLVTELCAWYHPNDKFTPIGDVKMSHPGKWHHLKNCYQSNEAYEESYATLRALKDLRRIVSSLTSTINDGIAQMEQQFLPVSRHYGIRTLPEEIMVRIMNLVGECVVHDPPLFERTMRAFVGDPPFNAYFKDAKALQQKWWTQQDTLWNGHIPRDVYGRNRIATTTFYMSLSNPYTLRDIRLGLKALKSLEHLSISCRFDFEKITRDEDIVHVVYLPNLHTLDVSNFAQEAGNVGTDDLRVTDPLRRIVAMLNMPNLSRISAKITSLRPPLERIEALDSIFNFSQRSYSNVKEIDIQDLRLRCQYAYATFDLTQMLLSCSALTTLSLCSCHRIFPTIDLDLVDEDVDIDMFSTLRDLTLEFQVVFDSEDLRRRVVGKLIPEIMLLKEKTALEKIVVKTNNAGIVQAFREFHPSTHWVTDRSILD